MYVYRATRVNERRNECGRRVSAANDEMISWLMHSRFFSDAAK